MNSNVTKKRNIALIAAFTIGSLMAIGFTGKTVIDMKKADEARVIQHEALQKSLKTQCIENIKSVSYSLETVDLNGTLKVIGKDKPRASYEFLTRISGAIQACPGYELEYACMGEDCEKSFFSMDLKEVGNDKS